MGNFIQFMFTPEQAGDKFHFWVPWIVFSALGLLIPFYYSVEGRKRFFGGHALHKYMLDRFMNQIALASLVSPLVMFGTWAMQGTLFSDRFWRYLWLLWLAIIFGYWVVFMIRKYPDMARQYRQQRTMERYLPQPKPKRPRRTARAGAR